MKVRHRENGQTYEVLEEAPSYYIVDRSESVQCTIRLALRKEVAEPIHDERWEDVTGECESTQQLTQLSFVHNGMVALYTHGYRLRKVRYADCAAHDTGSYVYRDAFIVERKVEG